MTKLILPLSPWCDGLAPLKTLLSAALRGAGGVVARIDARRGGWRSFSSPLRRGGGGGSASLPRWVTTNTPGPDAGPDAVPTARRLARLSGALAYQSRLAARIRTAASKVSAGDRVPLWVDAVETEHRLVLPSTAPVHVSRGDTVTLTTTTSAAAEAAATTSSGSSSSSSSSSSSRGSMNNVVVPMAAVRASHESPSLSRGWVAALRPKDRLVVGGSACVLRVERTDGAARVETCVVGGTRAARLCAHDPVEPVRKDGSPIPSLGRVLVQDAFMAVKRMRPEFFAASLGAVHAFGGAPALRAALASPTGTPAEAALAHTPDASSPLAHVRIVARLETPACLAALAADPAALADVDVVCIDSDALAAAALVPGSPTLAGADALARAAGTLAHLRAVPDPTVVLVEAGRWLASLAASPSPCPAEVGAFARELAAPGPAHALALDAPSVTPALPALLSALLTATTQSNDPASDPAPPEPPITVETWADAVAAVANATRPVPITSPHAILRRQMQLLRHAHLVPFNNNLL